jgi:hypothetical protein
MNQLSAGGIMIVLGIVLLVFYNKDMAQKENTRLQTPYLKNGGIGFLLFGLYYLARYFMN